MLHFNKTSRPLIHRLKYHGEWQTAEYLGQLLGSYLSTCELYASVDVVIPVPIHPLRRLGRTYNQSEYIARGVASALGVTTNFHSLYRRHYTSAQALKPRQERWDNFDNIFAVRKPNALQNKHILIVDDVYTSGATIFSCIDALHSALPLSKISIATLATGKQKIAFPQRE